MSKRARGNPAVKSTSSALRRVRDIHGCRHRGHRDKAQSDSQPSARNSGCVYNSELEAVGRRGSEREYQRR